jgi:2-polyprenyl-3-methyl-5-hydroxy-6-metoxy-1,4-benzoquinol methylase
MIKNEQERLNSLASTAEYALGLNSVMVEEFIHAASPWFLGDHVLELGPAEGIGTGTLLEYFKRVSCVEGSAPLAKKLQSKYVDVNVNCSLFENFSPDEKFDTVMMGHILEHVEDPLDVLNRALSWLKPNGRAIVGVPNSNSLHRQLGVELGIIKHQKELDPGDIRVGHRRVFDSADLSSLVHESNGRMVHLGGFWIKPLSNAQLESLNDVNLVKSLMKLGVRYPEISAELLAVIEA